jgi:hypothetical protein
MGWAGIWATDERADLPARAGWWTRSPNHPRRRAPRPDVRAGAIAASPSTATATMQPPACCTRQTMPGIRTASPKAFRPTDRARRARRLPRLVRGGTAQIRAGRLAGSVTRCWRCPIDVVDRTVQKGLIHHADAGSQDVQGSASISAWSTPRSGRARSRSMMNRCTTVGSNPTRFWS